MSIRQQLTSLIISTVILACFLAALHGYKNSLRQLDTIFDQELMTIAQVILSVADHTQQSVNALPSQIDSEIVFQVAENNVLKSASNNAPDNSIAEQANNEFGVSTFFGKRWRTYTLLSDNLSVVVAHPIESRSNSAEQILLVSILPLIIAIPIIAILIIYIVNNSLSSLFSLARQLKQKNFNDLSEVVIDAPPKELSPVIDKLNNLLTRLSQAFEREKHLSANAAHELRTPVSVLSLTAHNIHQEYVNGTLSETLIDELHENIARQAHVIEQMIALYRFSPEQFGEDLKAVNLEEVLQDVVSKNFAQIDKNKQEISLEGEALKVKGDYFALYILFENIIRNSIKYSGEGSKIVISIEKDAAHPVVTIEDSGPGLDTSEIEKIFNRFYRAENESSRVKGSGLGLSIVNHIVVLHEGNIVCSRSSLGGLKTVVTFPCDKEALDSV